MALGTWPMAGIKPGLLKEFDFSQGLKEQLGSTLKYNYYYLCGCLSGSTSVCMPVHSLSQNVLEWFSWNLHQVLLNTQGRTAKFLVTLLQISCHSPDQLSDIQIAIYLLLFNLDSWDWHHWKALCEGNRNDNVSNCGSNIEQVAQG